MLIGRYFARLVAAGFDLLRVVMEMTVEDLDFVGMTDHAHRSVFLRAASRLRDSTRKSCIAAGPDVTNKD